MIYRINTCTEDYMAFYIAPKELRARMGSWNYDPDRHGSQRYVKYIPILIL